MFVGSVSDGFVKIPTTYRYIITLYYLQHFLHMRGQITEAIQSLLQNAGSVNEILRHTSSSIFLQTL